MNNTFRNPILPGFHPDPSICRVREDYYLVTSTFEYFPGLPVYHSRDLVHWEQIGHVLTRSSQLPLDEVRASGGLYAPTIRYHRGIFYVINTLIDGHVSDAQGRILGGNFIVTAQDPAGPWSEPYWLEDAPGIDPSLFFDEDGRAWYTGNRHQHEGYYLDHTEIWLQELDLERMQLTGEKTILWDGALKGVRWAEAPHLYKVDGTYYLLIAEAGTFHDHAVTIARSEKIDGPYEGNHRNPILTNRHLGLNHPIVGTGHADLVETQNGEWWMVLLAERPYGGYYYNLGRETFLVPVIWEDGWPVCSPGTGRVDFEYQIPDLSEHQWPIQPACDNFEDLSLAYCWNFLRTPRHEFWSLHERPGFLRLKLQPHTLMETAAPSFVGKRLEKIDFTARTAMEFEPQTENEYAGLVVIQNDRYHFRILKTLRVSHEVSRQFIIQLIGRQAGQDSVLAEEVVREGRLYIKVEAIGQDYNFYHADQADKWKPLARNVDGRILSTPVAGGFTGVYLGMYASSNGTVSINQADFDWFEVIGRGG